MNNVSYLVASLILIWVLFVGYLGYLHASVARLRDRVEDLSGEE